eukprot:Skav234172  [mRNA]  locus=scaffold572:312015:313684:- [translate_table: standard]
MSGIPPLYLRLASTVCSLGVLIGNYQWLMMLPHQALIPMLLSALAWHDLPLVRSSGSGPTGIGTLIALSFIQDPEFIPPEPQRCPATDPGPRFRCPGCLVDWKHPPPAVGVRDAFPKYDPKDSLKSFAKICDALIQAALAMAGCADRQVVPW